MGSYDVGKTEVCQWIRDNIPLWATILDVGACDGKWRKALSDYPNMDAVEVYYDNYCKIKDMYRHAYYKDICDFNYEHHYDLIIFGDVLEHLLVPKAQKAIENAKAHANRIIASVPFLYTQGMRYGNPYEIHWQDDLTPELFDERYPDFKVLYRAAEDYCYYIW